MSAQQFSLKMQIGVAFISVVIGNLCFAPDVGNCSAACPYRLDCRSTRSLCFDAQECKKVKTSVTLIEEEGKFICADCKIHGCASCLDNQRCAECASGFLQLGSEEDEEKECVWAYTPILILLVPLGALGGLWFLCEVLWSARGAELNQDLALAHKLRHQAQVRNMSKSGFPPYSLFVSMHSSRKKVTNVQMKLTHG